MFGRDSDVFFATHDHFCAFFRVVNTKKDRIIRELTTRKGTSGGIFTHKRRYGRRNYPKIYRGCSLLLERYLRKAADFRRYHDSRDPRHRDLLHLHLG